MDAETGAILALQILALCSIVAALLAYLMRQSRNATDEYESRNKRHVLVTSCDTCVGLQIALALYEVGYKVFAGLLDPSGSSPSIKILRAMEQQKDKDEDMVDTVQGNPQDPEVRARGQIVPLELDPTREDSLRACLDAVRAKLPAGEDGLWAVVHTGGQALPGVIERQPSSAWESMLRHNLVAPLRTARVFIPLLRAKRGRIVLLGDSATSYGTKAGTGLVAYSASRKAVEGAAEALKSELQSSGVDVVLLKPPPVNPLILYSAPVLKTVGEPVRNCLFHKSEWWETLVDIEKRGQMWLAGRQLPDSAVGRGIWDLFFGRDLDSSCVNSFGPKLADSSVNIGLSTWLLRHGSEIAALLPMIWLLTMLPAHVASHTRLN